MHIQIIDIGRYDCIIRQLIAIFLILVMLNDNPMVEATSGEVEITDFTSDVIESLLFYMYNDFVADGKINCDLLKAANKVVYICSTRLKFSWIT